MPKQAIVGLVLVAAALLVLLWAQEGDDAPATDPATAPSAAPAPSPAPLLRTNKATEEPAAPLPAPRPEPAQLEPEPQGAGARLEGRVVDERDRPVPGARVRLWQRPSFEPRVDPAQEVVADAEGRFEFTGVRGTFQVVADRAGWACLRGLRGTLAPGVVAKDLTVILTTGVRWSGRVLDERGAPVAAAELVVEGVSGRPPEDAFTGVVGVRRFLPVQARVRSTSEGRFDVGPFPAQRWPLTVRHDAFATWYGRLDPGRPAFDVALRRGTAVVGQVLGSRGLPVEGATVDLLYAGPNRSTTTDVDGRFRFPGVDVGSAGILRVRSRDHAHHLHALERAEAGRPTNVTLDLARALTLAGVVVDEEGAPVAGAGVSHESARRIAYGPTAPAQPWSRLLTGWHTKTDAEGRFRFEQLPEDTYRLSVRRAGRPADVATMSTPAGREDLRIVLAPSGRPEVVIHGRVRTAAGRRPVRAFHIRVIQHRGARIATAAKRDIETKDGVFRLEGLRPGRYEVRVRARDHADWRSGWIELRSGERRLDVELHALATLKLRIVDAAGLPLPERPVHVVAVESLDGRPVQPRDASSRIGALVVVRGETLSLIGLPRTKVRVIVQGEIKNGRYPAWPLEVDLRGRAEHTATLVLKEPEYRNVRAKR